MRRASTNQKRAGRLSLKLPDLRADRTSLPLVLFTQAGRYRVPPLLAPAGRREKQSQTVSKQQLLLFSFFLLELSLRAELHAEPITIDVAPIERIVRTSPKYSIVIQTVLFLFLCF